MICCVGLSVTKINPYYNTSTENNLTDNLHHSLHKIFSVTASSTCQYTNLSLSQAPQLSDQCCTVNIQFFISHILFSFRSQIDVTFNRHNVENSGLCEIMLCQWLSCSQCFKCSAIIFKDRAVHEESTDMNLQKQCCEKPKSFKHIFHYMYITAS